MPLNKLPQIMVEGLPAALSNKVSIGDYGVGNPGNAASVITNADTLAATGNYSVGLAWTGSIIVGGSSFNQGYLRHEQWSSPDYATQEIRSSYSNTAVHAIRRKEAGVWTAWGSVYEARNVLGSVSQTGGVPTGALIQRGSDGNGEFVRYADGTMICTRTYTASIAMTSAYGNSFYTTVTWNFPSIFSATPFIAGTARASGQITFLTDAGSDSGGTIASFFACTQLGSALTASHYIKLLAVGRWF